MKVLHSSIYLIAFLGLTLFLPGCMSKNSKTIFMHETKTFEDFKTDVNDLDQTVYLDEYCRLNSLAYWEKFLVGMKYLGYKRSHTTLATGDVEILQHTTPSGKFNVLWCGDPNALEEW